MDRRTLTSAPPASPLATSNGGLGSRVRRLRNERGLTQTELAAARVSKEYISQIETGKTRPTQQMLDWLAERLGVDPHYLVEGVSDRDHREHEAVVVRAEEAVREKRYRDAVDAISSLARTPGSPELHLRALFAESWARMYLGELRTALDRLERARGLVHEPTFGDLDGAEVFYRLGCCRYKLTHVERALEDFTAALELADRSGESCDRLRANILHWRSRCYRRHRDWEAAREDIERAMELYEAVDDPVNVGRLLNNLGCLSFLLGDKEQAVAQLKDAFRIELETDDPAGAQAVSSLAQVHLRSGEIELAEQQARHALELLDDRTDYLDEIGNAQLVLGRALLEQGRLDEAEQTFAQAEQSLSQLSSASHRATAWTAQGELALARGDDRRAGALFRQAAVALQDSTL